VQGISKNYLYLIIINTWTTTVTFYTVAVLVETLHYKPEGRMFGPRWFHGIFSLTYSFRPHYYLGVDSASLTVMSTKCLSWGVKTTGAIFICRLCRNSWSRNILEPSGPIELARFTNGTASLIDKGSRLRNESLDNWKLVRFLQRQNDYSTFCKMTDAICKI
jgi:hypothetical protein